MGLLVMTLTITSAWAFGAIISLTPWIWVFSLEGSEGDPAWEDLFLGSIAALAWPATWVYFLAVYLRRLIGG